MRRHFKHFGCSLTARQVFKKISAALHFELGKGYIPFRERGVDMLLVPLLRPTIRIPLARQVALTSGLQLRKTTFGDFRLIARRTMSTPAGGATGPLTDKIKEDHEEVSRLSPPFTHLHLPETPGTDRALSHRCTNITSTTRRRAMQVMSTSPSAGRAS